jgi:hypothetical protein
MPFENQRLIAAREVLQKSSELELSEANKAIEAAGLVMKRAQLDGAETTLLSRMGDLAASSIAFYGFLNQISVPKTCPNGQTLNPITCECCTNCTGGKVFPDPMRGCECECPTGKETCGDSCYDPCTNGKTRSYTCGCECPAGKESCGDGCYDPCPPDHSRESDCSCAPYTPFMFSSEISTIEW